MQTYDLELAQTDSYRVWAYRKAAWAVDECAESVAEIYQHNGESGLQKLAGVGKSVAAEIGRWLKVTPQNERTLPVLQT